MAGLRELIERLRRRRQEELGRHDLGGVYDDIAKALRDVVETERAAVDDLERQAQESGDPRRQEVTGGAMAERRMELDLLPPDLAGQVRALEEYDFVSPDAARRFEELMDHLRQQLLNSQFQSMAGAMSDTSPEQIARLKDMLSALNEMIDQRERGEEPDFEGFMERFGDFFPENPRTLDELLEQMARQMAAMQAFMNSLTPEQRAQLQALSAQLLDDMDLRWQVDRLGRHLQGAFPGEQWGNQYQVGGSDPLGMPEAVQLMDRLGALDQLEHLLSSNPSPGALAEVDLDVARELLGDDGARSLERLAELARSLAEAGLIETREGRLELTPRGLRRLGSSALGDLFQQLDKDRLGQHQLEREGPGHERSFATKPYELGDPFNLNIERTVRNALQRRGGGTPVELEPADFEVDRTETLTRTSTVLLLDLSLSMPMKDNFLAAKKVAMALHSLISTQYPRDFLGLVVFSEVAAHAVAGRAAPRVLGLRVRHQHPARPAAGPPDAGPPGRHQAGADDHRRRAHRPHPPGRRAVLLLPARPRDRGGDAGRGHAVHGRGHLHQHVHARRRPEPAGLRRAGGAPQPGQGVLHHARDARQLRLGRLPRAEAGLPGPLGLTLTG